MKARDWMSWLPDNAVNTAALVVIALAFAMLAFPLVEQFVPLQSVLSEEKMSSTSGGQMGSALGPCEFIDVEILGESRPAGCDETQNVKACDGKADQAPC